MFFHAAMSVLAYFQKVVQTVWKVHAMNFMVSVSRRKNLSGSEIARIFRWPVLPVYQVAGAFASLNLFRHLLTADIEWRNKFSLFLILLFRSYSVFSF